MKASGRMGVAIDGVQVLPVDRGGRVVGGAREASRPLAASLSQLVLLLAAACGVVGFGWLVCDFSEVGLPPWSMAGGLAPLCLVWACAVFAGRSWPGLALGAAALACVSYVWRDALLDQGELVWDSVTSWTVLEGDIGQLLCVAFGLLGLVVGALVFAWNRGGLLCLIGAAVLLACPFEGVEPDAAPVALLVLYTAGILANGYVGRRFERRPSLVALGLGVACVALALAASLAWLSPEAFQAPARALSGFVDGVWTSVAERFGVGEGAAVPAAYRGRSTGLGGGTVNRGDLSGPDGRPLVAVSLSRAPVYPLYLASYRGGSYSNGVWSAAEDPSIPADASTAAAFEAFGQQNALHSAEFFAASVYALGAGEALLPGFYLRLGSADATVDAGALQPYAAVAVQSDTNGTRAFDAVGIGTYEDLCDLGVLDAAAPVGSLLDGPDAESYLYARGLELTSPGEQTLAAADTVLGGYGSLVRSAYLEVPYDELPRLSELVAQNPCSTQGEAIAFVKETLAQNARYTTSPGTFPSDVSIPEYLLFEGHAGYCQHFATTATLMLRMYGIPARYVTGFAAPPSAFSQNAQGDWESTFGSARAHAWVEVYAANLGWVPLEVTPAGSQEAAPYALVDPANDPVPDVSEPSEPLEEQPQENPAEQGETAEDKVPEAGPQEAPEAVDTVSDQVPQGASLSPEIPDAPTAAVEGTESAPSKEGHLWGPVVLGAALTVALVLVVLLAGMALVRRRRRIIASRAGAGADELLADLVALLHYAGLLEGRYGTEDGFADELAHEVADVSVSEVRHLVEKAMDAAFGDPWGTRPAADPDDLETYRRVAQSAYGRLGPLRRLGFVWIKAYA